MELTPQLLTDEIDFRIAVRGYDRHEVDDFLERVAVAVGQLQSQLTKAVGRAKIAEARVTELEAIGSRVVEGEPEGAGTSTADVAPEGAPDAADGDGTPDGPGALARRDATTASDQPSEAPAEPLESATAIEPSTTDAVPVPKAPPAAPEPVIGDDEALNEELRRTLVLAQRTADTAIREAHDKARTIVEEANDEARRNREAAAEAHAKARDEARTRLVAEIRELEATRETMRGDAAVLERYLGTERARVRETIQVLRRLVDEPTSFRTAAVPELSGVTTPPALGSGEPIAAPPIAVPIETSASDGDSDDSVVDADKPVEAEADAGQVGDDPQVAEVAVESSGAADPSDSRVESVSEPVSDGSGAAGPVVEASAEEKAPVQAAKSESDTSAVTEVIEAEVAPVGGDRPAPPPAAPVASGGSTTPDRSRSDSDRLGQLFTTGEVNRDWRSSSPERGDQGPHTQPVAAARFEEESDEAFLAELRRAMNDDEPLGPKEN